MKKIFFAFAVCSSLLFGCKSGGNNDPKGVLTSFFDALSKNDVATARKFATEESKSMLDMMEMGMKMSKESEKDNAKFTVANLEFGETKIDGDKAVVPVKEKTSGEMMNYTLKKEKGDWKVAFDKTSMMSMGMEKMNEKGINPADSLTQGLEELKNVDMDSLKGEVGEALKSLDSIKDQK